MNNHPPLRFVTLGLVSMGLLLLSAGCASTSFVARTSHAKNLNLNSASVALSGYDPVSYFVAEVELPARGKEELSVDFRGATYRFVDANNRQAFLEDPQRYAPAYGGWCAWAMVDGEKVEVDPNSFLIQDERLLLFYDGFFADTKQMWTKADPAQLCSSADREWRAVLSRAGANEIASQEAGSLQALGNSAVSAVSHDVDSVVESKFISRYNGKLYRFGSASERLAFLSDPERHGIAQPGS